MTTNQPQPITNNLDHVIEESKRDLIIMEEDKKKKGRGRPKKEEGKNPEIKKPVNNPTAYKDSMKSIILFSGVLLATGFKFKGFEITEQEAEQLAVSGSELAAEIMPSIDQKYVKIGAFIICVCSVYGIRVYSYTEHIKNLEQQKKLLDTNSNEVQNN